MWDLSFPTGDLTRVPFIGGQIREIPNPFFIYLFILAVLVFCCCAWAFSSYSEWGLLFIAVHGLLIEVAFLVVEHGLEARGLQ